MESLELVGGSPAGARPGPAARDESSLTALLFDGLPALVLIVTAVTQPFAQRTTQDLLGLRPWVPILVALAASTLVAVHRLAVVRRLALAECAICLPLLTLTVFSAYTTGNNAVFFVKEGYTLAGTDVAGLRDQLAALGRERDVLQDKLRAAEETMRRLIGAVDPTQGRHQPPARSLFGRLGGLVVGQAEAQPAPARPGEPPREGPDTRAVDVERIRELLQQYQAEQRKLDRQLNEIHLERQKSRSPQQQPLIKSW